MNQNKLNAFTYIDESSDLFTDLSEKIWGFAELSLKEEKSADLFCEILEKGGFKVERGISNIQTAFTGTFGEGLPKIAILGEFDALSGLSQKANCAERIEIEKGGSGHGCGHNLLGAGSLAAAFSIKNYLETTKSKGTVVFCGCPGEEGGAAKAFMARDGFFKNFDAALTWHPGDANEVPTGYCNSSLQILYKFKGTASHAAGNPESGRSALDALELMNTGVQYLREHVKPDARMHYAIIDGGGFSPNVVQPTASVLYMLRSIKVSDVKDIEKRVDNIAKGAALMTDTCFEKVFIDGTSSTLPNNVLEKLMHDNLSEIPMPEYTQEELDLAQKIYDTIDHSYYVPGMSSFRDEKILEYSMEKSHGGKDIINRFVVPLFQGYAASPGSTDVGDVARQTPTAQVYTSCFVAGSPGHSWQNVSAAGGSIGEKGMLLAAKTLAASAIDLFENPDIIARAKEEFNKRNKEGYVGPIPDNEMPKIVEL